MHMVRPKSYNRSFVGRLLGVFMSIMVAFTSLPIDAVANEIGTGNLAEEIELTEEATLIESTIQTEEEELLDENVNSLDGTVEILEEVVEETVEEISEVNKNQTVQADKNGTDNSFNSKMKLWYDTPANVNSEDGAGSDWMQQSLPLGNGNIGNLIFGGIARERIHFNEQTLWTGGPADSRQGYLFGNRTDGTIYSADEILNYRRVLDDKTSRVFNDENGYGYGMNAGIRFRGATNVYKGSYQDFGDIWLDYSLINGLTAEVSSVTGYRRELDMQKGIASTEFTHDGTTYRREHFVSYPDNVMVTKLTASTDNALSFKINMELHNSGLSVIDSNFDEANGQYAYYIHGKVNDNGLKFYTRYQIVLEGGSIQRDGSNAYRIDNADEVIIIMSAETNYKNDFPLYRDTEIDLPAVVSQRVRNCAARSYEDLMVTHLEDWQEKFDRVELDLNEVNTSTPTDRLVTQYRNGNRSRYLEVLAFQFGRFLSLASSRGKLPSNLVGIWTVGGAAWTGDYHFNVNVQMNYWPVYATNLIECSETFVEYMDSLREPGRITAERVHGITNATTNHNGFTVHTENNPFGMTAPTNHQEYGWNPTGAAWAIQNLWWHYEYTKNMEYLRTVIYPIMKEAALFWDNYLWYSEYQKVEDENSPYNGQKRLVVAPSFSAEQGPTAVGTTYDQSLVWELYNECVQAATILDTDRELAQGWAEKMKQLDPININATNGIKEWYEETRVGLSGGHNKSFAQAGDLAEIEVPNSGWWIGHPGEHRHASHLVGLFPGTLINSGNQEYMDAAIQSLTERDVYSTGWSKANKINLWARTGNGNKAYTVLNNLIGGNASGLQLNLFDSHGSNGGETMMSGGGRTWQIDGNFGLTSGVAEMLIQSQNQYVEFLPAIPDAWATGRVAGLKARGNFTIGESWSEGMAERFTVRYDGSDTTEFSGKYKGLSQAKVYANGQLIERKNNTDPDMLVFDVVGGVEYTIDLASVVPDEMQEEVEEFLSLLPEELVGIRSELGSALNTDELKQVFLKAKKIKDVYDLYIDFKDYIIILSRDENMDASEIARIYNIYYNLGTEFTENTKNIEYYKDLETILTQIKNAALQREEVVKLTFSHASGYVSSGTAISINKAVAAEGYEIRYTTDGSIPTVDAMLYINPIPVSENIILAAAVFKDGARIGPVYRAAYTNEVIGIQSVDSSAAQDWGANYAKEKMIDANHETRYAPKSSRDPLLYTYSLDGVKRFNRLIIDAYVSTNSRNNIGRMEVFGKVNGSYEKLYETDKVADNSMRTGNRQQDGYSIHTCMFSTIETDSFQIKLYPPASGDFEPSFYEVEPCFVEEYTGENGMDPESEELLARIEEIISASGQYNSIQSESKSAFENLIKQIQDRKQTADREELAGEVKILAMLFEDMGFNLKAVKVDDIKILLDNEEYSKEKNILTKGSRYAIEAKAMADGIILDEVKVILTVSEASRADHLTEEDGKLYIDARKTGTLELVASVNGVNQDGSDYVKKIELIIKGDSSSESDDDLDDGDIIMDVDDDLVVTVLGGIHYSYTGTTIRPAVRVTMKGKPLTEGIDYSVSYKNNTNVPKAGIVASKKPQIIVTGKKNYRNKCTVYFDILPKSIEAEDVVKTAAGAAVGKIKPELIYNNQKLANKKDYTYTINADSETVFIQGIKNYKGSVEIPYEIATPEKLKISLPSTKLIYNGKEQLVEPVVTCNNCKLSRGEDYVVVYDKDMTNAGKHKVTVVGMGRHASSKTFTVTIAPAVSEAFEIAFDNQNVYSYTPTGVTIADDLIIKDVNGSKLVENKDYRLSYINNKKVGKAICVVNYLGNYKGHKKDTIGFTIGPASLEDVKVFVANIALTGKTAKVAPKVFVTLDGVLLSTGEYSIAYYTDEQCTDRAPKLVSEDKILYAEVTSKNKNVAGSTFYKCIKPFRVSRQDSGGYNLSKSYVDIVSVPEFNGELVEPEYRVYSDKKKTLEITDGYEVLYVNNYNAGKATLIINGQNNHCGSKVVSFKIRSKNVNKTLDWLSFFK